MDEGIMKIYDKTMRRLDHLGVSWDPKDLERREIIKLLNDTEKLNGTVSEMILKRFKAEMTLRKEKLAFTLDKVYHLKH
jgi:hypothetical protein